ncbi:MAG: cytochrome c oxidase subunit II [Acidimicrobiales bacterium]
MKGREGRPREVASGAAGNTPPRAPVSRRSWGRRRLLVPVVVATAALSTACGEDSPSVLDPSSDAGRRVEDLWWVLFWISAVVVAVVTAFLIVATVRRRRADTGGNDGSERDRHGVDTRPVPWGDRFVVIAGVVVPGGILAGTFAFSLGVFNDLADPPEEPVLEVEVVAHTWWWEVRYPDGVVTANEIRVPAGETVELALPTADVIHSFWVPELQVKMDHIPGTTNRLWLVADRAGRFRGQCAEFCGLQHAHMEFEVVALQPEEFEDWLEREAEPAAEPETGEAREGAEIFAASSCAGCHAIRGTSADGTLGPDLTHLADRETIGAGLIPLTAANLDDFITDPQDDKLGVSMPPTELSPREVDAVVAYLMELE